MKIAIILILFSSSVIGVFGDTDELKSVSVMEGDSVTLHTRVTKIQGSDSIEWRLNGYRMARIYSDSINLDKLFRDTMQLNNITGDLKITNVRLTDSGLYKLKIKSSSGSPEMTFNVTVVISSGVKSVSVMEGDSVTLNTGVYGLQRDDVIRWRHQNILIAEIINNKVWRFRDRLKLDNQTGSLTITDTTTKDAGDYEVDITISSSRHTIHKSFSVNVTEVKSVSVTEGDSFTLISGHTEVQRDDVIRWSFGITVIAEIIKADERFPTHDDGPDGRFRDRLKLDNQTGSLNITNTRTTDSGEYGVEISTNSFTVHKRISVTVDEIVTLVLVKEGDSVTLRTGAPILGNHAVLWFGDNNTLITPLPGSDARWKNTVHNDRTGDLTIRNIRSDQSGDYKVIFMDKQTFFTSIHRKFHINIIDSDLSSFYQDSDLFSVYPDSDLYYLDSDPGQSSGAVAWIVVGVLLVAVAATTAGLIYQCRKSSKPERSREVNGQNQTSDDQIELTKPAEAV